MPFSRATQPIIFSRDICMNCKQKISTKVTTEYYSEICYCGCLIRYFPKPGRDYATRAFISKEEYEREKTMRAEREKLLWEMKNRGIDVKVAETSKLHRTLTTESKKIPTAIP